MGHLFWLSDEQCAAIEPHMPKNQPGARRVDDRTVISGIIHVLKVGCRWCNGPVERMHRTTKDATVKRFHGQGHDQLREQRKTFLTRKTAQNA